MAREAGTVLTGTEIRGCTCRSEYQDKRYGPGLRVHNRAGNKAGPRYGCTVCGKGARAKFGGGGK